MFHSPSQPTWDITVYVYVTQAGSNVIFFYITANIPYDSLFHGRNFLKWRHYMDTDFNKFAHVGTTVVVVDHFGCKNTIWDNNLQVVVSQEHSSQDVHFLYNHLHFHWDGNIRSKVQKNNSYVMLKSKTNEHT